MTKARELAELSRTIIDTSDATAITINADEEVTLADDLFLADGKKAVFGAGSDLQIYHDGGNSYIAESGDGDLIITTSVLRPRTDQFTLNNAANNAHLINAEASGAVSLYHAGVKKFETDSSGATLSGVLTVIDGSTSAPSISNAGDSNTGIYFPADDELGFLVGGSRKVHITSSGVAIQNGTLTAAGNVGIGTARGGASPNASLQVAGENNGYDGTIRVGERAYFAHRDSGNTKTWVANNYNSNSATFGIRIKGIADSDEKLTVLGSGNVGIGEQNPDASLHITSNTPIISFDESDASQEYRIGSFGGTFAIYDSTDSAYRVAVDGSGNVGIGETSPSAKLHIKEGDAGSITANTNFDQLILEDDQHSGMQIWSGTNYDGGIYFGDPTSASQGQFKYQHQYERFVFVTNNGQNALTINSDDSLSVNGDLIVTTQGNTNTIFRVQNNSASGQGGIQLYGVDANHSIFLRRGNDGTLNTNDYHQYGQHRFFTGGVLASQTEKMKIPSDGRVSFSKYSLKFDGTEQGKHEIRTGGRTGTGTYTLFTNGISTTQSAGIVEVWGIYGTPSGASYRMYVISGNRSIVTAVAHTQTNSVPTPVLSWSGAALQITNSNSSLYYHVRVTLHDIGNGWAATWGNFPGLG